MDMTLGEAILLGSTLLRRIPLGGTKGSGEGCALQMAALAVGREDLAHFEGGDGPYYVGIADFFSLPKKVVIEVAIKSDRREPLEDIAAWVDSQPRTVSVEDIPTPEEVTTWRS